MPDAEFPRFRMIFYRIKLFLGVDMKKLAEYVSTLKHGASYEKKALFEQVGSQVLSSNAALITVLSLINRCPRANITVYSQATLRPAEYAILVERAEEAIKHNSPMQQSIHRDVYIAEKGDVDWLMIVKEGQDADVRYFVFY